MNQRQQSKDSRHANRSVEKRDKKLNGYLALYRRELLLLREGKLKNLAELGARIVFLLLADWDQEHDAFGCIPSNTELQRLAGMNHSRWSHYRRRFVERDLLHKRDDGKMEIPHFWKYNPRAAQKLSKTTFANTQEEDAFLQNHNALTQITGAKKQNTQENTSNGTPEDIGSLIQKSGKYLAFSQRSSRPKKTKRNSKENIKNFMKYTPKDIKYECEKCGLKVDSFTAQLVTKRTTRKICMPCYLRRNEAMGDAAVNAKPPLS